MARPRRHLLIVAAALEVPAGAALLWDPSFVADALLGAGLVAPEAFVLGRLAGAGVAGLGIAAWIAWPDDHSRAATAVIAALAVWNGAAAAVLALAALRQELGGDALWPVLAGLGALAAWCLESLRA
jgi:hypothetical protein